MVLDYWFIIFRGKKDESCELRVVNESEELKVKGENGETTLTVDS